ncbi:hypothetical protein GA0061075_10925 [Weissella hellenica]|uniref:Uncharacterized protein n=1 Tax=Weissella hellenica TaxID=46256 RepID=A0ABY0K1H8_WEIHE|nr:hypothetical protein GA0061075_10925 [Weissella hellenica]
MKRKDGKLGLLEKISLIMTVLQLLSRLYGVLKHYRNRKRF